MKQLKKRLITIKWSFKSPVKLLLLAQYKTGRETTDYDELHFQAKCKSSITLIFMSPVKQVFPSLNEASKDTIDYGELHFKETSKSRFTFGI